MNPVNATLPASCQPVAERVRGFGDAIDRYDPTLRSLIFTDVPGALGQAALLDRRLKDGHDGGALAGLVFAIKDVIDQDGTPTTNGARFFAAPASADAEVVKRLKAAGAILIGKTNLHEFAYGATTQNPHWGNCRNPWDIERIPGGSSGGSACAVAAGFCDVSLGTDTGGSGRLPAALTGIAGLRPTIGRISNSGVTACSPLFDTISPMARRVSDIARTLTVLAGYDPNDPLTSKAAVCALPGAAQPSLEGLRIAVAAGPFFDGASDLKVQAAADAAIATLEELGATCVKTAIPDIEEASGHFEKLFHAGVTAYHAERLATAPDLFGPDILDRLRNLGGQVTGPAYAAAHIWGEQWRRKLELFFSRYDAVVHPAIPTVAPRISDVQTTTATTRKLARFCYPWSMAGVPGLSVPAGFAEDGMPCGLLVVAPWWREDTLLRIGTAYQSVTDWHLRTPDMAKILERENDRIH